MKDEAAGPPGYWNHGPDIRVVLEALRRFLRADQTMRRRVSAAMDMNVSDLQALQLVVAGEGAGRAVSPRDLSAHLGISTASTTALLDRLTASGHLVRAPHPTDRRSVVVRATSHAHQEIRERLDHMHRRMAAIAAEVPHEARAPLVRFLEAISDELESADIIPLTPAPDTAGEG